MTLTETILLFSTMTVLAAIPSASVALVIARTMSYGTAHGLAVSGGIVLGDLVFVVLAMLGLSVVAETLGGLFLVIKYAGAAYLVWLGIQLLRTGATVIATTPDPGLSGSLSTSFLSGFILTLGDIKAIYFYLSLLPQFIDVTALQTADALVFLLVTLVAVGGTKVLYAMFARRLVTSAPGQRYSRLSRKTAGTALVCAGGYLAVKP